MRVKYQTFLFIFVFLAFLPALEAQSYKSTVIIEDSLSSEEIAWIGPGWYYGIWFGDEHEFKNWYKNHQPKISQAWRKLYQQKNSSKN